MMTMTKMKKLWHRQKRRRLLLVVWAEIVRSREERTRQRNALCTYLTRSDLNPSPRIGTPWQHMHARGNDRAFITKMGKDITTFEYLFNQGFSETWNTTPIPRNDILLTALPRTDRRSLDAAGTLGLTLHYLASTMRELSLQQTFGLIPLTVIHYPSEYNGWLHDHYISNILVFAPDGTCSSSSFAYHSHVSHKDCYCLPVQRTWELA
jgi:hypothetical protein